MDAPNAPNPVLCTAVVYVCKSERLSRGKVLHMYIHVGALQYTKLIFWFLSLQVLARIKEETNATLYVYDSLLQLFISIFAIP